jgi:hypothetical protein
MGHSPFLIENDWDAIYLGNELITNETPIRMHENDCEDDSYTALLPKYMSVDEMTIDFVLSIQTELNKIRLKDNFILQGFAYMIIHPFIVYLRRWHDK